MFTVKKHDDERLETLSLHDDEAKTSVTLAPNRGGMVARFSVGEQDVLYMDDSTLNDTSKNVRGGNPVLFPSPGKLEGDAWSRDGKHGALKQHGFARNSSWEITGQSEDEARGAAVTLRLTSDKLTLAEYPWDFRAEYTYSLKGTKLRIDLQITHTGDALQGAMPFGAGFHPYFAVAQKDKASARLTSSATSAFDNVTKTVVPFSAASLDLATKEVDLHLIDHGAKPCALSLPDHRIELSGSAEFSNWVIWTLPGKDFVCVEPWTCPGNALNTGDRLIVLGKGESRSMFVEIEIKTSGAS